MSNETPSGEEIASGCIGPILGLVFMAVFVVAIQSCMYGSSFVDTAKSFIKLSTPGGDGEQVLDDVRERAAKAREEYDAKSGK